MKKIFKSLAILILAISFNSCSDSDNVIDKVTDDVTNGAVLRGDDDTLITDIVLDVDPALFFIDIEEQDNQDGDLMESVDVFVTYSDNSTIAGDSSPANTSEVLAFNIPAEQFTVGEFGLPVTSISLPLTQLLSLVGLSNDDQVYVNDTFTIRLALNLTDGRVFTDSNAGAIITGGFFNSPFLYTATIRGGMDISFEEEGTNEINIVPGATNDGYSADVLIDEVNVNLFDSMLVYASYVDNNEDAPELDVDEMLIGTFPRSAFVPALDDDGVAIIGEDSGNPVIKTSVAFDLNTISVGVDIMDMSEGDAVELRYVLINSSGREISATTPPFVQTVPVTSCEVGPLADDTMFVGNYELEHLVNGIFNYQTFGEGEVVELFATVTDATQDSPGVPLTATQRAFDASYLFAAGSGLFHTYVIEFNCTDVTIADENSGPIGGFTGWTCTQANSLIVGPEIGGGDFDVTDDSEFVMGFRDDLFDDCGIDPAVFGSVKFIKQ